MSLKELNELEREAGNMESGSKRYSDAADQLQRWRNEGRTMQDILKALNAQPHNFDATRNAFFDVLEESKADLMRLAELRLAALSRDLKVKAAQRRAVLRACILPLPEGKQGGAA